MTGHDDSIGHIKEQDRMTGHMKEQDSMTGQNDSIGQVKE